MTNMESHLQRIIICLLAYEGLFESDGIRANELAVVKQWARLNRNFNHSSQFYIFITRMSSGSITIIFGNHAKLLY